ncbi:CTD kinase subunit alpha [Elsinoe australis]|uniref:CTD kinase subunit alpha n=1 Tax=Elsinoe australis TaxID=40998 RepID=A0A2P8A6G5_9PEZI|nr:CTD kinase subunit alpha [Elsinoe australis]
MNIHKSQHPRRNHKGVKNTVAVLDMCVESMALDPTNKAELAKLRREMHNTDQLGKRIKMMTEAIGNGFAFAIA